MSDNGMLKKPKNISQKKLQQSRLSEPNSTKNSDVKTYLLILPEAFCIIAFLIGIASAHIHKK